MLDLEKYQEKGKPSNKQLFFFHFQLIFPKPGKIPKKEKQQHETEISRYYVDFIKVRGLMCGKLKNQVLKDVDCVMTALHLIFTKKKKISVNFREIGW